MSGFMGYDVDLLTSLLVAMQRSDDELRGISTNDPSGQTAMSRVKAATGVLGDHWIPFVRGLLSSRAMTGYTPATIAGGDLLNGWLRSLVVQNGWRTITDPLASADEPMTPEQAAQLATWLSDHADDLDHDLDDDEVILLEQRLAEILASPSLARAFSAGLTTEGVTGLANELGDRRADLMIKEFGGGVSERQQAELDAIDAAYFDLAGIILFGAAGNPDATPATELVAGMDPYAAALLVQHLHLSADDLATIAAAKIELEQQDLETANYTCGVRAADIFLKTIDATVGGASRFVVAVADSPGLLLSSATDSQLADKILLDGTLPAMLSPAEQEAVIPSFIEYIIGITARPVEPYSDFNPDIFDVTGALMAPYLLQLFDSRSRPLLGDSERQDAWDFVFDNPALLDYFVDQRERMALAFTEPLGIDPEADRKTLTAFSALLGLLDGMYEQGEVRAAERDRAKWDLSWTLLGLASNLLPVPGITQVGVGVGLIGMESLMAGAGWAPDEIDQVRLDTIRDTDKKLALVASIVVGSTFTTLVDRGRIPRKTPPPPRPDLTHDRAGSGYVEALNDWAAEVDLGDGIESWVLLAGTTVLNPYAAAKAGVPSDDDD